MDLEYMYCCKLGSSLMGVMLLCCASCQTAPAKITESVPQSQTRHTSLERIKAAKPIRDALARLNDSDPVERAWAAYQLGKFGAGATPAVDALINMLADDSTVLLSRYLGGGYHSSNSTSPGEEAAIALGRIGQAAVSPLHQQLKSSHPTVRRLAAKALGQINDLNSVPHLINVLRDSDRQVHAAAAIALGSYRHPMAAQTILDQLPKAAPSIRSDLIYALAQINDVIVVPVLVQHAKQESPEPRAAIMYALGRLRDSRALATLLQGISDSDEIVRANAAYALSYYFSPQTIDALLNAVDDPSERVRHAAQEALQQISGITETRDSAAWRQWWQIQRQQLN